MAYVESYDDILFWKQLLDDVAADMADGEGRKVRFDVALPSRNSLCRGKKMAMGNRLGPNMIACVDADYDYLEQGSTPISQQLCTSPYVLHTYVYAIENFQCYADSLHNVAVMVTLNDHAIFDFSRFLREYSEICYPLFVWSVWAYRTGRHTEFPMSEFDRVVELGGFSLQNTKASLEHLRHKVERKVHWMWQHYPKHRVAVDALDKEMRESLGVTPETTYLYMQGHHLFDSIVAPIMTKVCNSLRTERETEISRTAVHKTQMHNELSCYENSLADVKTMLKKNMGYMSCPLFLRLQEDVAHYLVKENFNETPKS